MALTYVKKEMTLSFRDDKPKVYKIAQQTVPAVTFQQLVTEVAASCGVNATMTKAVVEGLIDRLCHFMELGHGVQVGEFGSFKPVFNSKTKKTKDELSTENITAKKVRFYPGKRFRDMMEDLSVVNQSSLNSLGQETETPNPPKPDEGGGTDFS